MGIELDERSTLQFRSNIFPITTKGQLINDQEFLASISDPEALAILWRYNGSRGKFLNKLQQKQHDAAKHCAYAEEGDFPWGTPIGSDHVVCLCEKTDCPRFGECTAPLSGGEHPNLLRDGMPSLPKAVASSRSQQPTTPAAPVSKPSKSGDTKKGSIFARGWSEGEKRRLREAYLKCKRETLYKMFPHRSSSDVDWQINQMGLAAEPQPRHQKTGRSMGTMSLTERSHYQKKPKQKGAKKKRKKAPAAPKPWTLDDDVLIRRNYPQFGTNMALWDARISSRSNEEIELRAKLLGVKRRPQR